MRLGGNLSIVICILGRVALVIRPFFIRPAAEIMEVAKDVVKRIEETKKQIESAKKSEEKMAGLTVGV